MNNQKKKATTHFYKGRDYHFNCHHDPFNERIRIDEYAGNKRTLVDHILELFNADYTKCIIKVKDGDAALFQSLGFSYEGEICGYFSGVNTLLMTKYRENWRRNSKSWIEEDAILEGVLSKTPGDLSEKPLMRQATKKDAGGLAELYKHVFAVYPTPMDNPDYIRKVMKEGTIFLLVEEQGTIKSAASAELNRKWHNAEVTDCATLPDFRKGGTMRHLIMELEKTLLKEEIYYAYSIARARSFGMNAVLHQLGYAYGGRLVNNVKIYTDWENMNLWSKMLTYDAQ
ncbi:putative beta-lysine N-acetyltransferase [Pseudalkalibacillus hwajinpoensis]|uniref:putative beta-lysine N-acetyltransferase n=1 Tax=Guptibacillus hwajinpoensis TaxID=208199 RepID=UPI00325B28C8